MACGARTERGGPPDVGDELINASDYLKEEDKDDSGAEAVLGGVHSDGEHGGARDSAEEEVCKAEGSERRAE